MILINGLGGIGKTVLATAYVQLYGDSYDHLAWINRGEDLIASIAFNEDLAETLKFPMQKEEEMEERFRTILRKLHHLPGNNLLVIDNAQEQVAQKDVYDHLPGRYLKQYSQALYYNLKALDILEPKLYSHHPLLSASYKNLSIIYHQLGKKDKAKEYEAKAETSKKAGNE